MHVRSCSFPVSQRVIQIHTFEYAFRPVLGHFARGLIKNAITKREDNVEGRTTITVHDIQVQNLGYKVCLTQVSKFSKKNFFRRPPLLPRFLSLLSQVPEISLPFFLSLGFFKIGTLNRTFGEFCSKDKTLFVKQRCLLYYANTHDPPHPSSVSTIRVPLQHTD